VQNDKQEKAYHLLLELKLDPMSKKMGEQTIAMSPIVYCSCQTKVEMAMVKAEKEL